MDLFGTNNAKDVDSSIQKVRIAVASGKKPDSEDLRRVEKAAEQAGSTGNDARRALNGK